MLEDVLLLLGKVDRHDRFVAGGGEASGASMDSKSKTINERNAPLQIITGPAALRDSQDISVVL
jgi:hypothetical protein